MGKTVKKLISVIVAILSVIVIGLLWWLYLNYTQTYLAVALVVLGAFIARMLYIVIKDDY